ncbi:pilus assembly protein PilM [Fibrobacter sp. UWP2]|uniref:pilus assembly protein PilM n=1 Tax=Fibrobacter sp. UWP2 TaxID=1896216 RepID=UPI000911803D|nr:pilus assembly protein PilM [Fibrobacter sp. UWP2]SHJ42768.1 type IV pilus assembly protein PilM [Fibrobacter sp. UWP2]
MALGLIAKIRGERETVGIDVGHYSIKYVKVYHNSRGGKVVVDADLEPVPEGAIVNGEIQHREGDAPTGEDGKKEKDGAELLNEAMSRLLIRHPIDESVDVVASVNCGAGAGGVLVDRLSVKVPKNGNEAAIILQTAQSRPPFDDQDNVIDYEVESRDAEEVTANVVAAKNALLDSWAQFFKSRSLKLSAMDVDIFGLVNSYMATASAEDAQQTAAIVNIGEKKMSIAFVQNGKFHSMRAMTGGSLDLVIAKLCTHLGVDAAKCHEIFEKGDMSIVDGFSEAEVEETLKIAFEDLMGQIEFGIRYFSSSEDSSELSKILLGGGGASIPGLKAYIAERTGIETDTVNPFRYVECDAKVFGEGGISLGLSNIYAPALGLAMRKF